MLNLDQVRLLESKVERAVQMIKTLHTEKDSLKKEIEARDKRISELEKLIVAFKDDQSKIEEGIINALTQLSAFEDASYTKNNELPQQKAEAKAEVKASQPVKAPVSTAAPEKHPIKQESADSEDSDNLQKDLDDVLGSSSGVNQQMDIF